jgi:hypothetical protein
LGVIPAKAGIQIYVIFLSSVFIIVTYIAVNLNKNNKNIYSYRNANINTDSQLSQNYFNSNYNQNKHFRYTNYSNNSNSNYSRNINTRIGNIRVLSIKSNNPYVKRTDALFLNDKKIINPVLNSYINLKILNYQTISGQKAVLIIHAFDGKDSYGFSANAILAGILYKQGFFVNMPVNIEKKGLHRHILTDSNNNICIKTKFKSKNGLSYYAVLTSSYIWKLKTLSKSNLTINQVYKGEIQSSRPENNNNIASSTNNHSNKINSEINNARYEFIKNFNAAPAYFDMVYSFNNNNSGASKFVLISKAYAKLTDVYAGSVEDFKVYFNAFVPGNNTVKTIKIKAMVKGYEINYKKIYFADLNNSGVYRLIIPVKIPKYMRKGIYFFNAVIEPSGEEIETGNVNFTVE